MLNGCGYDEKIDLWCLGIFTYEMVKTDDRRSSIRSLSLQIVGKPPFDSQTQQDTIRLIRTNDLSFPPHTSVDARELISRVRRKPFVRSFAELIVCV
jgi:aurora kinase A